MPSQSTRPKIPLLRYTLRCLNGHEVPYDTPEWPGLIPVHCQVEGCGWHVNTYPVGQPEIVKADIFAEHDNG